jgi:pre-rRNA-processing protein TSR3
VSDCPHVLIVRDFRESPRKCSLTPLRGLPGIDFTTYHHGLEVDAADRILLHHEGPELSRADAGRGLLLLDSSWRRLPKLERVVRGEPLRRSLPRLDTAYPRESRYTPNPEAGLASVEALYAALAVLWHPREELLAGYHWRAEFLAANAWLAALVHRT